MYEIVTDDHATLVAWAEQQLGERFMAGAYAIGQRRDGELVAVVVYEYRHAHNCNAHIASVGRHWLTRRFLVAMFHYPFIHLGAARITGIVPARNRAALRLNQHLGFTLEGVCREALPDDDLVIMGMLRRECRFIRPRGTQS